MRWRSAAMQTADCAISHALRDPEWLIHASGAEWDAVIRQGRRASLLARLHYTLAARGCLTSLPAAPLAHLEAARVIADKQATAVRWEVGKILSAIAHCEAPLILLKGAAYHMAGLTAGRGRVFSDIDILVPKSRINHVEAALMQHGWVATQHDAYDQRYYRTWMHEIPPLQHIRRQSVIDVHHAILPETARLRPDPALLLAAAQPILGAPGLFTLAPADMVLHSASHLFCGEFDHGLRDLSDIDLLLREFSARADFWTDLVPRARQLDLTRPLYYALTWAARLFATPIPAAVLQSIAAYRPSAPHAGLMHSLLGRALTPDHPSCRSAFSPLALGLLYARAHWLRMPPHLLAYHLAHKALLPPKKPV
jgi:hypothetical protein